MNKHTIDAMKEQMRPSDELVSKLEARLAAECGDGVSTERTGALEHTGVLEPSKAPAGIKAGIYDNGSQTPWETAQNSVKKKGHKTAIYLTAAAVLALTFFAVGLFAAGVLPTRSGSSGSEIITFEANMLSNKNGVLSAGDYSLVYEKISAVKSEARSDVGSKADAIDTMTVTEAAASDMASGASGYGASDTGGANVSGNTGDSIAAPTDPAVPENISGDTAGQDAETPGEIGSDTTDTTTNGSDTGEGTAIDTNYEDEEATDDSPDYYKTNTQVNGIDEADIVKTDGRHIYAIANGELVIFAADGANTTEVSRLRLVEGYDDVIILDDEVVIDDSRIDAGNDSSDSSDIGDTGADAGSDQTGAVNGGELDVSTDKAAVDAVSTSYNYVNELYLSNNKVFAVVSSSTTKQIDYSTYEYSDETILYCIDVADPANPVLVTTLAQSGSSTNSRLYDDIIYLVSTYYVDDTIDADDPGTYVPKIGEGSKRVPIDAGDICIMPIVNTVAYTTVSSIDCKTATRIDEKSVLGDSNTVYMSTTNLYIGSSQQEDITSEPYFESVYTVVDHTQRQSTQLARIAINKGSIEVAAQGVVAGGLLNQFSLDEHDGNLRLAVTKYENSYKLLTDESHGVEVMQDYETSPSTNAVYVLDSSMQIIGQIDGLAQDERIYSVRFSGDIGYMVTFKQVDPLFTIDLSDPRAPKVTSELKIPGFSTYLHPYGDGQLLGIGQNATQDGQVLEGIKLSMFDTADPYNVSELYTTSINLGDYSYSDALNNHKAVMVDKDKNLIGFGVTAYESYHTKQYFIVCSQTDLAFEIKATLELEQSDNNYSMGTRGFYIDDYLYVYSGSSLSIFDLESFELLSNIKVL